MMRRTLLGSIVAGLTAPKLAFSQSASSGDRNKVEFAFGDHVFTATLSDNPSARDFASMLPLNLELSDFSDNEKIAYLPRKLTVEGNTPYTDAAVGDLCYYVPWGNIIFYYGNYSPASSVVRLGRLDAGIQPLMTGGKFPLRIRATS